MSLVERTAQRLDQLRKAGEQVGGELVYSGAELRPGPGSERSSTVERAARELSKHHDVRTASTTIEPTLPSPEPDSDDITYESTRREPKLRQAAPAANDSARRSRSRLVNLDTKRLAAHGLLTSDAVGSPLANELRVIKRPLINNALGKSAAPVMHGNRIMITSSVPGEGKSFLAANLAMTIAMERDSTVLLVEADPTRPTLTRLLGVPPGLGLMDLLLQPALDVADLLVKLNIGRLTFLPSGTRHGHATELLASAVMEKLIEHLASRYPDRVLIFDAPPLLAAPEARVLARYMGQIVLVVEAGKTTHSVAQQALAAIESCPVILPVLNKASAREERMYYYAG